MDTPLTTDTSPDVEQRQLRGWREMSPAHKAELIVGLSQAVRDVTLAGVRHRYPHASPREHFLRLAILTLGADLARCVYPDIEQLGLE